MAAAAVVTDSKLLFAVRRLNFEIELATLAEVLSLNSARSILQITDKLVWLILNCSVPNSRQPRINFTPCRFGINMDNLPFLGLIATVAEWAMPVTT